MEEAEYEEEGMRQLREAADEYERRQELGLDNIPEPESD
jgi:hypothetical protein